MIQTYLALRRWSRCELRFFGKPIREISSRLSLDLRLIPFLQNSKIVASGWLIFTLIYSVVALQPPDRDQHFPWDTIASCLNRSSQLPKLSCWHSATMAEATDNTVQITQTLATANARVMSIRTPPHPEGRSLLVVGNAAALIINPCLKELFCSGLCRSGLREAVVHCTNALLRCALAMS